LFHEQRGGKPRPHECQVQRGKAFLQEKQLLELERRKKRQEKWPFFANFGETCFLKSFFLGAIEAMTVLLPLWFTAEKPIFLSLPYHSV